MSRLRRLVLSDRYFFVTCNVRRSRRALGEHEFGRLASNLARMRERVAITAPLSCRRLVGRDKRKANDTTTVPWLRAYAESLLSRNAQAFRAAISMAVQEPTRT